MGRLLLKTATSSGAKPSELRLLTSTSDDSSIVRAFSKCPCSTAENRAENEVQWKKLNCLYMRDDNILIEKLMSVYYLINFDFCRMTNSQGDVEFVF